MAKDFTLRGGRRTNQTGRPKKALKEKLDNGNPGHRKLKVLDAPDVESTDIEEAVDMPPVKEYLSAIQRDGQPFMAAEIYKETYKWLAKVGCEKLVNSSMVELYAASFARWIQCNDMITKYGIIAKHPTTGAPIQSPYVNIAHGYMKSTNLLWMQIYQIVKENSTVDYHYNNPQDDLMEKLLNGTWRREHGMK